MKLLLRRHANVAARNKKGRTCLHLALEQWQRNLTDSPDALKNSGDAIKLMIKAGADVTATDNHGTCVSQIAITRGLWNFWSAILHDCGKSSYEIYPEAMSLCRCHDSGGPSEHCCLHHTRLDECGFLIPYYSVLKGLDGTKSCGYEQESEDKESEDEESEDWEQPVEGEESTEPNSDSDESNGGVDLTLLEDSVDWD